MSSSAKKTVFLILATLVALFHFLYHEPWRDETQAWLIATWQQPSLPVLWQRMVMEGHPPLLYFLLQIESLFFTPAQALAVLAGAGYFMLLVGTNDMLRTIGVGRNRAFFATVLLGLTHNYFYEYGVIARGYGLGLGLALLGASKSLRATKPANPSLMIRGQLIAGLAMLTSAHVALFVTCCNLALLAREFRNRHLAVWIPTIQAPFLVFLGALMTLSISQRQITMDGVLGLSGYAEYASGSLAGLFTLELWRPVSFLDGGNLIGRYFLDAIYPNNWWPLTRQLKSTLSPVWRLIFVVLLYVVLVLGSRSLLRKRQRDLLIAISLTGVCLAFFYARIFPEYLRHTLVAFIPLMILLVGFTLTVRSIVIRWSFLLVLSSVAWMQLLGNVRSLRIDQVHPFSSTRAIAESLPQGTDLLASADFQATSVAFHRPDVRLRAPEHRGKGYVFVEWDAARTEKATLEELVANTCREKLVIYTTFEFKCAELLLSPSSELAKTDELLKLYRLPCDCLAIP